MKLNLNGHRNTILFSILIGCVFSTYAQEANFSWAKSLGGSHWDVGESITVDKTGNVFTTGFFIGTSDYDPGPNVYNLTAQGDKSVFISKLSSNGAFVWAKEIGMVHSFAVGTDVAVDHGGNVYVTGYFSDSIDCDPGPNIYMLKSNADRAFIIKLDSTGEFVWANAPISPGYSQANEIKVDASGNVYSSGAFSGVTDFDPGINVYNLSANGTDTYLYKLNSTGTFGWVKSFSGYNAQYIMDFGLDSIGNIYCSGMFHDSTDFDPGPGKYTIIPQGVWDGFLVKLDSSGNFISVRNFGGSGNHSYPYCQATDKAGNAYIAGRFLGTIDLDPGAGVYNVTSTSSFDLFVSKLDADGLFVWGKLIPSPMLDNAQSIVVDEQNNSYIGGTLGIIKLDSVGDIIWTKPQGGEVLDIAIDHDNNLLSTGQFFETVDFDPGSGVYNLIADGSSWTDVFVVKLCQTQTAVISKSHSAICQGGVAVLSASGGSHFIWNTGDTTQTITVSAPGNYSLVITNGKGCRSISSNATVTQYSLTPVNYHQSQTVVCSNNPSVPLGPYAPGGTFSGTYVNGPYFNAVASGPGTFVVVYAVTDANSCTNTATSTITVNVCTGIPSLTDTYSFTAFPNPSSGYLVVSSSEEGTYNLLNELGQTFQQFKLSSSNNYSVTLENLSSGIYFIVGNSKDQMIKQKVVVTK
ncbi:MAG: T9SS type A sorting domain-containing protein [Bacteroidota bacterium]